MVVHASTEGLHKWMQWALIVGLNTKPHIVHARFKAVDIIEIGLRFFQEYGLPAMVVLLILDGALLLPVFPGEIVIIMGVASYATDIPSLLGLILIASVASLIGSLILYGVIRIGGRRLVDRFPGFFMMPPKRRKRLETIFAGTFGGALILIFRLLPLTRILVNIPAGLAKMPVGRFLGLSSIGILIFHAAFMGFIYEVNRPGSTLATETERLEEAYASPAWSFVEANMVFVALGLASIGIIIAVRAASDMYRNPRDSVGSPIGWMTSTALIWGGVGLAVTTYVEPDAVFAAVRVGGFDVRAAAILSGVSPFAILWASSGILVAVGAAIAGLRRIARRRKRQVKKVDKRAANQAESEAKASRTVTGVEVEEAVLVDGNSEENSLDVQELEEAVDEKLVEKSKDTSAEDSESSPVNPEN
jgi:membrane protein DedA with SNARE-associated domain